ncbi:L-sorbose 1-dehydrogenase [Hypsizygus marmoreus]|uniref:L-sorbose 1-dehydrogenase n=1 Tax=Hypsizygus marmoreus TaxID=39966 RepID=A0A369JWL5_HYPMA|nr:L-sorbose 1-dehydrogenase [Hypsizygus marmoreus]
MAFLDLARLYTLLEKLKVTSRAHVLLGSGGLAAFVLVLRYLFAKDTKYISNLAKVGRLTPPAGSPDPEKYDVIIVGGGTSGCVLAARLSEDPNIRVLLLEAGQSGTALTFSRTPSLFARLFPTKHVLQLRSEPQAAAKGRTQFWPRAKMLGGCSAINAQMAHYGSPEDFDEWAVFMGDDSWTWKNFGRYFTKFENYQPHPDYPLVDASARGADGPIKIGYFNTVTNTSKAFIKACVNVGIPFTPDFNVSTGTLGVSRIMTYIDEKRQRVSSESAYLTKDVLARKNLTVAINAQATRVLFEDINGEKRAVGVEFAHSSNGPQYSALSRKEVIICAGAVQSPHILMLSGVGPAAHLKEHGIPVVHSLPDVGKHLVDHPVVDLYFKDKHDSSSKYFQPNSVSDVYKLLRAFVQYFVLNTGGPLATNFGESAAFIRSDDPALFPKSEYPETLPDSTSGPGSPDLELFTTPLAYKEHGKVFFDVHTYALHVYLTRPRSTGEVLLRSSSPWDIPSVNPNYLKEPEDAAKLLRGVRLLLKIAQTEPLTEYLDQEFKRGDLDHQSHLKSDEELLEMIRERVETLYHPASTCRMAPADKEGVVDSQLRVYGIKNLRVCDASIFPWIVSGHTAGACFAIAEKLSDDVKASFHTL